MEGLVVKWGFRTCCLEGLDVDWDFAPSALRVGRDSELHSCCLVGLVVNSGFRVCSLKGLVSFEACACLLSGGLGRGLGLPVLLS